MASAASIRRATLADAPAIAALYNHYVERTVVTFEEERVEAGEMARRIADVLRAHEWLVATREEHVLGYAYAAKFRERASYRYTTESTIYLAPEHCGQGLGAQLYRALLARIFELGYRHALGVIALPNDASVRLHEKLGFVKVAHFLRVGMKFGSFIDVGAWQLENAPSTSAVGCGAPVPGPKQQMI